nr:mitochondrial 37S ribosomal protein nam9 [Polyrhizophydium stewartii]
MSWDPRNLENLVSRTKAPDLSKLSVFQQKWLAKRELRGYHVPNISEKQFINRHFVANLPNRQLSQEEKLAVPPIQALMFGELERRVDVVVFRSHFADSIWKARKLVVQGDVLVNGVKSRYPARRLEDGDMITVKPRGIPTLRPTSGAEHKFVPKPYMSPWMFTPAYLEVDYKTCSTVFLRTPVAQPNEVEVPSPLPPTFHQLVFEWYVRRKRAKKIHLKKPLVVAGQTVRLKPKFDSIMRMDQETREKARRERAAQMRTQKSEELREAARAEQAQAQAQA